MPAAKRKPFACTYNLAAPPKVPALGPVIPARSGLLCLRLRLLLLVSRSGVVTTVADTTGTLGAVAAATPSARSASCGAIHLTIGKANDANIQISKLQAKGKGGTVRFMKW